jgi:hypothetical protein
MKAFAHRGPEVGLEEITFLDRFRVADNPRVGLLWFAFQGLANREQENGTLVFCVR